MAKKTFFVGFTSTRCYTLSQAIIVPTFGPPYFFFFSKIGLRLSIDIILSYHRVQFQKKTNDPILSKLSEGRKDGRE